MKKSAFSIIFGVFLINLISAYNGFGYSSVFNESVIVWAAVFLIFFALINFILGRTIFKQDKTTRSIIALSMTALIIYGLAKKGINISSIYVENLFFSDFLSVLIPWLVIIGIIITFITTKWRAWIILGVLLILVSLLGFVYTKSWILTIGIILILIGIKRRSVWKRKQREKGMNAKEWEEYKGIRKARKKREAEKWRKAGYKIGKGIGRPAGKTYGATKRALRKKSKD